MAFFYKPASAKSAHNQTLETGDCEDGAASSPQEETQSTDEEPYWVPYVCNQLVHRWESGDGIQTLVIADVKESLREHETFQSRQEMLIRELQGGECKEER